MKFYSFDLGIIFLRMFIKKYWQIYVCLSIIVFFQKKRVKTLTIHIPLVIMVKTINWDNDSSNQITKVNYYDTEELGCWNVGQYTICIYLCRYLYHVLKSRAWINATAYCLLSGILDLLGATYKSWSSLSYVTLVLFRTGVSR